MKNTLRIFGCLLVGLCLAYSASTPAATSYNVFVPANGILKGSTTTPVTTAAAWSDVSALLSGTCNSSVFVRADGTCVAVNLASNVTGTLPVANGGTNLTAATDDNVLVGNGTTWQSKALTDCDGASDAVTYDVTSNAWGCNTISTISGAALTKTDDANVTLTLGGSPTTALVNAASITAGWTGTLAASRGGLGMSTVTDDTVAVANGTTWQSKAITDCDDSGGNHLNYDTATNAFSCGTSASGSVSGANPSASVGLSAVNGSAGTFMRSDGAPALSQSISPTWTGNHTFAPASGRAWDATGVANSYTTLTTGSSTSGQSFGALINAGTNSSDAALLVQNQAGTKDLFRIRGDSSMVFGNSTDNPSYTFSGAGAATFGGAITAAGAATVNSGATAQAVLINSTAAAGPYATLARSGTGKADIGLGTNCGGSFTADALCLAGRSGNAVEISAGGRTSPDIQITSAGAVNLNQATTVAGTSAPLRVKAADTVGDGYIRFDDSSGAQKGYIGFDGSSDDNFSIENDETGVLRFGTNGAFRATIATDGGLFMAGATGSSQGAGTINATGLYINGVPLTGGITSTGTFTGTLTGYASGPTCSMKYRLVGSTVFLFSNVGGTCTGTSNATSMTMTGLPAAIQPSRAVDVLCLVVDNGAASNATCSIASGGSTVTMTKAATNTTTGVTTFGNNFITSGSKGIAAGWGIVYDLGN